MTLVSDLGELPVEFIKYVGLKHIVVLNIQDKKTAGYADVAGAHDTFYSGIESVPGNIFDHELSHLKDAKECGSSNMFIDKDFDALNPKKNIYLNPGQYISRDKYGELIQKDLSDLQLAKALNKKSEVTKIEKRIAAVGKRVFTTSEYGKTALVEDKAEISADLLNPFFHSYLIDKERPILRRKAIFLAARIYQSNPKLLKYFSEISV